MGEVEQFFSPQGLFFIWLLDICQPREIIGKADKLFKCSDNFFAYFKYGKVEAQ